MMDTCKWHAVIKFAQSRPHIDWVREIINKQWGLVEEASVGILDTQHILVAAQNEEDYRRVLARDVFKMDSFFRIFKWSFDYRSKKESPIVTRWIRLPRLPANYYVPSCLEGIGNSISKFVKTDEQTFSKQLPVYARMCIKMDLSKQLPIKVWLGTSLESVFWQPIIIEGRKDYCLHCNLHGHVITDCRAAITKRIQLPTETPRKFCTKCRINNHNSLVCRWIQTINIKLFLCELQQNDPQYWRMLVQEKKMRIHHLKK